VKGATSANARDEVLRLLEGAREFQNPANNVFQTREAKRLARGAPQSIGE
jgi:hypothetical protein